jgi:hypothetical protein
MAPRPESLFGLGTEHIRFECHANMPLLHLGIFAKKHLIDEPKKADRIGLPQQQDGNPPLSAHPR